MGPFRYFILIFAAISSIASIGIIADDQETDHSRQMRERDFEALRDYLRQKEHVELEDKDTELSISGDVRFEWQHLTETQDDIRLRGPGATDFVGLPISRNDFDVEFNLKVDYAYKKAWAAAHLQFDNGAGVGPFFSTCLIDPQGCYGSGDKDKLNLKRAYIGYNIWESGDWRLDIEMGRRKMFDLFDSLIQFDSRFDGIVLKFEANKTAAGDWYWRLGGFVIDERVNHFGYVTEVGLLNIYDSGCYVKYSFIDWVLNDRNRCHFKHPRGWWFRNSQVTIGCFLNPFIFGKNRALELYGAVLVNHAARRIKQTHYQKKNIGWYVGALLGEIDGEGDWSFELDYELVQVQAVSDCDSAGIGRGNIRNESFTGPFRRGNANYKGINAEFLYAITDNLLIDTTAKFSTPEDSNIGGSHRYSVFEVEAIYAF